MLVLLLLLLLVVLLRAAGLGCILLAVLLLWGASCGETVVPSACAAAFP